MDKFFEYFAGGEFAVTTTIIVMVAVFVFLGLMMYVPALTKRIFPKFGYAKYANYLPFKTVFSDNSIELTDGTLVRADQYAG